MLEDDVAVDAFYTLGEAELPDLDADLWRQGAEAERRQPRSRELTPWRVVDSPSSVTGIWYEAKWLESDQDSSALLGPNFAYPSLSTVAY